MSRVSILIPSYNHAEFLPACFESIKSQTFSDWHVTAIDDGSTDNSVEILKNYCNDKISVLVNQTNLGTYGTLARALESDDTEYVAVLNSDDHWASQKLRYQVDALDAYPEAAFCYTLGAKIDADGKPDTTEDIHSNWPKNEEQELLPFLLSENRILASSVLFRRTALRFRPELRYAGDWVALLDASLTGNAVCIPQPLAFWRMHNRNSFRRSAGQVAEEILVRRSIIAARELWSTRAAAKPDLIKGLSACAMHLSALLVLQGRVQEARAAARFAALKAPGRASLRRLIAVSLPARLSQKSLWKTEGTVQPMPESGLVKFGI